ncbi:MAG TPA: hypothetical protein VHY91_00055 [Pirellulales bacterium]|jgi:hypothetical protein|nr:hypothetical protein [Pirellulales bacterium]
MSESNKGPGSREIATITFGQGSEAGIAIVRQIGARVAVTLSLRHDGDTEAILGLDSARELLEAIRLAVDSASRQ